MQKKLLSIVLISTCAAMFSAANDNTKLHEQKIARLEKFQQQMQNLTLSLPVYDLVYHQTIAAKTVEDLEKINPYELPEQKEWIAACAALKQLDIVSSGSPEPTSMPEASHVSSKNKKHVSSNFTVPTKLSIDRDNLSRELTKAFRDLDSSASDKSSGALTMPFNSPPKS